MKKLIFSLMLLLSLAAIQAQPYGHCSFGQLLSEMPETTASDAELKKFNDELVAKGSAKADELKATYEAYLTARNSGEESPRQLAEREKKLSTMQEELEQLEAKAEQQLDLKRRELLAPIIEKANKAVEDIAKENGYQLIFDSSMFSVVMFAEESVDITPLVKKKLGIQ